MLERPAPPLDRTLGEDMRGTVPTGWKVTGGASVAPAMLLGETRPVGAKIADLAGDCLRFMMGACPLCDNF